MLEGLNLSCDLTLSFFSEKELERRVSEEAKKVFEYQDEDEN